MIQINKLLIVFNDMEVGGIQRKILDLICYLKQNKSNTKITLCLRYKKGRFLKDLPYDIELISPPKCFTHATIFPFWLIIYFLKTRPSRILTFQDYWSISTIIANLFSLNYGNVIIDEQINIKKNVYNERFPLLRFFFIKHFYHRAYKIITPSKFISNQISSLTKINKHKIKIIRNWLPVTFLRSIQKKKYKKNKKNTDILYLGRLVPQKNLPMFLQIIKFVKKDVSNLRVKIVGSGTELAKLKEYSRQLGLTKNVSFFPATHQPEKFYLRSNLFIVTSKYEGFPFTILETSSASCLPIARSNPEFSGFFSRYSDQITFLGIKDAARKIIFLIKNKKVLRKISHYYQNKVVSEQSFIINQYVSAIFE